jgi:hypothetical protein
LDPEIKRAADLIYNTDKVKYERLVRWIAQAQKQKFSNPAIVASLTRFLPYAGKVNGEWWGYLDRIIYKEAANQNAAEHEREHSERKAQEGHIPAHLKAVLKGVH